MFIKQYILIVCILLLFNSNTNFVVKARLVLWNRLGPTEIYKSVIGSNFNLIQPGNDTFVFEPSQDGFAFATQGLARLTASVPNFFGSSNPYKGTIAIWIQKKMPECKPGGTTPLIGIVGKVPYEGGYDGVSINWVSEDEDPIGGPNIGISAIDQYDNEFTCRDKEFNSLPTDQWIFMAFTWNLIDGIEHDPNEKMRVYRDGNIVCTLYDSSAPKQNTIKQSDNDVIILGNHQYNKFGSPLVFIDDIKVYNEPMNCVGQSECIEIEKPELERSGVFGLIFMGIFGVAGVIWIIVLIKRERHLCTTNMWQSAAEEFSDILSKKKDQIVEMVKDPKKIKESIRKKFSSKKKKDGGELPDDYDVADDNFGVEMTEMEFNSLPVAKLSTSVKDAQEEIVEEKNSNNDDDNDEKAVLLDESKEDV